MMKADNNGRTNRLKISSISFSLSSYLPYTYASLLTRQCPTLLQNYQNNRVTSFQGRSRIIIVEHTYIEFMSLKLSGSVGALTGQ